MKKLFIIGLPAIMLVLGLALTGCAAMSVAIYRPPPQSPFSAESVANGEYFFINPVYGSASNNVEGLCFLINLGTFDPMRGETYELIFPELGTGPANSQGITLHTYPSDPLMRDISILPAGANFPIALLRNGRIVSTNETSEEFLAGRHYFLYKMDGNNFPMFYTLSNNEETIRWGRQEISKSTIIDGINAVVALEYGWRMEETESLPSMDTLERRNVVQGDREGAAIGRYIQRTDNVTSGVYIFTNDVRPGETFYAEYFTRGLVSGVNIFRKVN